ncbi:hypothetical protein C804_04786 [Lachnospiraceae bacterium A4]|jgi:hypothetical protein|nr:hypothetical protein C804_04786 [Lachnospiraceae bacterium A4]
MKKIKRMYIIIILIFISIISRYKFRNIEREETGQTAKKENDGALQNFEAGLNAMPMSEMEMEEHEEQNELTGRLEAYYKTFLQPNETPICIYEGMNKFAVYKKTLEKNIIFVDVVFVEKETNRIFTWQEDEMIPIGNLEDGKVNFSEMQDFSNKSYILMKKMAGDELLVNVMSKLEQNGLNHLNLIYDGTIKFLNRNYYMISSFESFEDHIIRNQGYYIDSTNGDIYCVAEDAESLRTELFYIDNLYLEKFPDFS